MGARVSALNGGFPFTQQKAKLFDAAVIFLFNKSSFRSRWSPMTSKFSIPANEAQAYSLMRTYGITDDELSDYISTMLGEIKILGSVDI